MRTLSILLSILTLILTASCGKGHQSQDGGTVTTGSIVGGSPVKSGQFESVVALTRDGHSFCTGNLIDEKTILTAGHCVQVPTFTEESLALYQNQLGIVMSSLFTEEQLNNASPNEALEMIRTSIKKHAEIISEGIKFHFGSGKAGSQFEGEALEVEAVELEDGYVDYLAAVALGQIRPDMVAQLPSVSDKARFHLKKAVSHVEPTPLATKSELASLSVGDDVITVGFGLQYDARLVEGTAKELLALKEKIEAETDPLVQEQLIKKFQDIGKEYLVAADLLQNSGTKHSVTTKIAKTDSQVISIVTPDYENALNRSGSQPLQLSDFKLSLVNKESLKGTCQGDSGGPTFIKNAAGEFRQVGVTSTGIICGFMSNLAPVAQ